MPDIIENVEKENSQLLIKLQNGMLRLREVNLEISRAMIDSQQKIEKLTDTLEQLKENIRDPKAY